MLKGPLLEPFERADGTRAKTGGRRVLVADDNVDLAEMIATALRLYGHQVTCVYNGIAALFALNDDPPDIVVLDIGMPGMSGYEVAAWIRKNARLRTVPLVAISGYGDTQDQKLARQAGFDAYMTKPVDPAKLNEYVVSPRPLW